MITILLISRDFAMRTAILLVLLLVAGGAATSIAKAVFLPSSAHAQQERLLAAYRLSPKATLNKIKAAYLACADSTYAEGPAADDIRHLAALLTLEAVRQGVEHVDDASSKAAAIQLMQTHLPRIKAKLAAPRDEEQVLIYLQALRGNGVPSCVVSSAA
jgi:hypothetical protein